MRTKQLRLYRLELTIRKIINLIILYYFYLVCIINYFGIFKLLFTVAKCTKSRNDSWLRIGTTDRTFSSIGRNITSGYCFWNLFS